MHKVVNPLEDGNYSHTDFDNGRNANPLGFFHNLGRLLLMTNSVLGEPIILTPHFKSILKELEDSSENYLVTGKAGTGKSTLLRLFIQSTKKRAIVLAPTGVSALHIKGQTIHSFFSFPPRLYTGEVPAKRRNRKLFTQLDTIIIDEISMVRADLLDQIDIFLRIQREIDSAFGGVQMLFFGDLFQLPPIINSEVRPYFSQLYDSPYFFSSRVMHSAVNWKAIELNQVFRQKDKYFINLLDDIRLSMADWNTLEELNQQINPIYQPDDLVITLATRNNLVDKINATQLAQLKGEIFESRAIVTGDFPVHNTPVPTQLELKRGAQVMCLRNDPQLEYANGTLGKFIKMEDTTMVVEIVDAIRGSKEIKVQKCVWENIKYKSIEGKLESSVVGSIEQYPVKLAWAVTIHKSQGQTFDKVFIDMGSGAFEFGQTYVALSRCKSLEGIILKRALRMKDIMVDDKVVNFYRQNF